MDLRPFDGLVDGLRSRRDAVARHADELHQELVQLGWEGPAADRFTERERHLIGDLQALAQAIDAAMVTAQELVDQWDRDVAEARNMIHAFHGMLNRIGDMAGDAIDGAADAVNYDDWPVKPGDAIPQPGDRGWQPFSDFMKRHI